MSSESLRHSVPAPGTREWFDWSRRNKAAFQDIPASEFTKYGLMRCSKLIPIPEGSSSLWYDEISVTANKYVSSVADYLEAKPALWDASAIRVVPGRGIFGRAQVFGVPFQRAVEMALSNGFMKSEFYLPNQQDGVFYATLLFHINKRKESNNSILELQTWQYCPGLPEVFYMHAESEDFSTHVTHFDGSILDYAENDIQKLFAAGNKIKARYKEKQFQIDGTIPLQDMFAIARLYCPTDELLEEAFELRTN